MPIPVLVRGTRPRRLYGEGDRCSGFPGPGVCGVGASCLHHGPGLTSVGAPVVYIYQGPCVQGVVLRLTYQRSSVLDVEA